jgi:hypothetical protein
MYNLLFNQLEQILQNLEDDRKKSKTIKKRKKLQETCTKIMTRLIVDWKHERHQEEEAASKRLEEARKM